MEEIAFGQTLPEQMPERLRFAGSRALLAACTRHPDIVVRELREVAYGDGELADAIVIDVDNRQVPARNPFGIQPCEPLLLIHREGHTRPYDVRALRADFPVLLHQNAVPEGEPVSLCLYEVPWSTVERRWTPSRFLDRTLWWLGHAACGNLHAPGQQLEQLFYDNGLTVVVPARFENVAADVPLGLRPTNGGGRHTFRLVAADDGAERSLAALVVRLATVGHPPLARMPKTLGALADHLAQLGADVAGALRIAIDKVWPADGAEPTTGQRTLVLLQIPRAAGSEVDRIDSLGMFLGASLGTLGVKLGALDRDPQSRRLFRSYATALNGASSVAHDWRDIKMEMTQVAEVTTRKDARLYTGIRPDDADFNGVLAGLGALGSAMFDLWYRVGWGQWTLVDDDAVAPHNVVRHTAIDADIGWSKVVVCARQAGEIFPSESAVAFCDARIDGEDEEVCSAIASASLLVDGTTSLAAARNLSVADHRARTASVFLSPSGKSGILLLEDNARRTRLIALEAQYYRALLESPWGEEHLAVAGVVRPGATCRDLSFVLSPELVQLHAAILCQQVRVAVASDSARICVWTQEAQGGVTARDIPVADASTRRAAGWTIGWDCGLRQKLQFLRSAALPAETGGVLLGILDTALKHIQVVDAMPAPVDSAGSPTGFTRGTQGVHVAEAEVRRRTQGAVEYIGDWHSHPPGHSTQPSVTDLRQVATMAERLDAEDVPALIMIVGEPDSKLSWTLGRGLHPEAGASAEIADD